MVRTPGQKNPPKHKLVVVLGMHRSGTSVITRSLQVLSVSLGNALLPAAADNVKGFWEDRDIVAFNEQLLASLDRSWCSVATVTPEQIAAWRERGLAARAATLLRGKMAGVSCFGLKDPRLALLLPFWQAVFAELDLDVRYVLAFRDPASVARSLERRNGLGRDHGNILWLGHVLGSLRHTLTSGCLVVDYDRVLQAPEAELQRLAAFLDLDINAEALRLYRDEFLDAALQHHKAASPDLPEAGFPYSLIAHVRAVLAALAGAPPEAHQEEISARSVAWLQAWDHQAPVLRSLDDMTARLHVAAARLDQGNRKTGADTGDGLSSLAHLKATRDELLAARTRRLSEPSPLVQTQIALAESEIARRELEDRIATLLQLRPLWRRLGSRLLRRYRRLRSSRNPG